MGNRQLDLEEAGGMVGLSHIYGLCKIVGRRYKCVNAELTVSL